MDNQQPPWDEQQNFTNCSQMTKPNVRNSCPTDADIRKLFKMLGAIYNNFMAQFPDSERVKEGRSLWKMALIGFSWDDIKRGVAHCVLNPRDYFPTCAQFRGFCITEKQEVKAKDGFHRASPEFVEAYEKKYGKVIRSNPSGGYHQETPKEATRKCFAQWEALGVDVPGLPEFDELLRVAEVDAGDYVRLYSFRPEMKRAQEAKKTKQEKPPSRNRGVFQDLIKKLAKDKNATLKSAIVEG